MAVVRIACCSPRHSPGGSGRERIYDGASGLSTRARQHQIPRLDLARILVDAIALPPLYLQAAGP